MSETYLVHHGIKGQKWGVRRFQNEDGSVTPAGAERYYTGKRKYDKQIRKVEKYQNKIMSAREKNRAKMMSKFDKKLAKQQADLDSYKPIKNGLKDKKGRDILTKDDVKKATDALKEKINQTKQQQKEAAKNWDEASKTVEYGFNKYKQTIKSYTDAIKMEDLDATYGYTDEYDKAVNDFIAQRRSARIYGAGQTILGYVAAEADRKEKEKNGG